MDGANKRAQATARSPNSRSLPDPPAELSRLPGGLEAALKPRAVMGKRALKKEIVFEAPASPGKKGRKKSFTEPPEPAVGRRRTADYGTSGTLLLRPGEQTELEAKLEISKLATELAARVELVRVSLAAQPTEDLKGSLMTAENALTVSSQRNEELTRSLLDVARRAKDLHVRNTGEWIRSAQARSEEVSEWFPPGEEEPPHSKALRPPPSAESIYQATSEAVARAKAELGTALTRAKKTLESETYTKDLLNQLEETKNQLEAKHTELNRVRIAAEIVQTQVGGSEATVRDAITQAERLRREKTEREDQWQEVMDAYESGIAKLEAEHTDLSCKLRVAEQSLRERDLELHLVKTSSSTDNHLQAAYEKLRVKIKALEVAGQDKELAMAKLRSKLALSVKEGGGGDAKTKNALERERRRGEAMSQKLGDVESKLQAELTGFDEVLAKALADQAAHLEMTSEEALRGERNAQTELLTAKKTLERTVRKLTADLEQQRSILARKGVEKDHDESDAKARRRLSDQRQRANMVGEMDAEAERLYSEDLELEAALGREKAAKNRVVAVERAFECAAEARFFAAAINKSPKALDLLLAEMRESARKFLADENGDGDPPPLNPFEEENKRLREELKEALLFNKEGPDIIAETPGGPVTTQEVIVLEKVTTVVDADMVAKVAQLEEEVADAKRRAEAQTKDDEADRSLQKSKLYQAERRALNFSEDLKVAQAALERVQPPAAAAMMVDAACATDFDPLPVVLVKEVVVPSMNAEDALLLREQLADVTGQLNAEKEKAVEARKWITVLRDSETANRREMQRRDLGETERRGVMEDAQRAAKASEQTATAAVGAAEANRKELAEMDERRQKLQAVLVATLEANPTLIDVESVIETALSRERDHAESAAEQHLKKCNERLSKASMRSANLVLVALTQRRKKEIETFRRAMCRYARQVDRQRRFEARQADPHPRGFARHDGQMTDPELVEWIGDREVFFSPYEVEEVRACLHGAPLECFDSFEGPPQEAWDLAKKEWLLEVGTYDGTTLKGANYAEWQQLAQRKLDSTGYRVAAVERLLDGEALADFSRNNLNEMSRPEEVKKAWHRLTDATWKSQIVRETSYDGSSLRGEALREWLDETTDDLVADDWQGADEKVEKAALTDLHASGYYNEDQKAAWEKSSADWLAKDGIQRLELQSSEQIEEWFDSQEATLEDLALSRLSGGSTTTEALAAEPEAKEEEEEDPEAALARKGEDSGLPRKPPVEKQQQQVSRRRRRRSSSSSTVVVVMTEGPPVEYYDSESILSPEGSEADSDFEYYDDDDDDDDEEAGTAGSPRGEAPKPVPASLLPDHRRVVEEVFEHESGALGAPAPAAGPPGAHVVDDDNTAQEQHGENAPSLFEGDAPPPALAPRRRRRRRKDIEGNNNAPAPAMMDARLPLLQRRSSRNLGKLASMSRPSLGKIRLPNAAKANIGAENLDDARNSLERAVSIVSEEPDAVKRKDRWRALKETVLSSWKQAKSPEGELALARAQLAALQSQLKSLGKNNGGDTLEQRERRLERIEKAMKEKLSEELAVIKQRARAEVLAEAENVKKQDASADDFRRRDAMRRFKSYATSEAPAVLALAEAGDDILGKRGDVRELAVVHACLREARWQSRCSQRAFKEADEQTKGEVLRLRTDGKRGTWLPLLPPTVADDDVISRIAAALAEQPLLELQAHAANVLRKLVAELKRWPDGSKSPRSSLENFRLLARQYHCLRDRVEALGGWAAAAQTALAIADWPCDERCKILELQLDLTTAAKELAENQNNALSANIRQAKRLTALQKMTVRPPAAVVAQGPRQQELALQADTAVLCATMNSMRRSVILRFNRALHVLHRSTAQSLEKDLTLQQAEKNFEEVAGAPLFECSDAPRVCEALDELAKSVSHCIAVNAEAVNGAHAANESAEQQSLEKIGSLETALEESAEELYALGAEKSVLERAKRVVEEQAAWDREAHARELEGDDLEKHRRRLEEQEAWSHRQDVLEGQLKLAHSTIEEKNAAAKNMEDKVASLLRQARELDQERAGLVVNKLMHVNKLRGLDDDDDDTTTDDSSAASSATPKVRRRQTSRTLLGRMEDDPLEIPRQQARSRPSSSVVARDASSPRSEAALLSDRESRNGDMSRVSSYTQGRESRNGGGDDMSKASYTQDRGSRAGDDMSRASRQGDDMSRASRQGDNMSRASYAGGDRGASYTTQGRESRNDNVSRAPYAGDRGSRRRTGGDNISVISGDSWDHPREQEPVLHRGEPRTSRDREEPGRGRESTGRESRSSRTGMPSETSEMSETVATSPMEEERRFFFDVGRRSTGDRSAAGGGGSITQQQQQQRQRAADEDSALSTALSPGSNRMSPVDSPARPHEDEDQRSSFEGPLRVERTRADVYALRKALHDQRKKVHGRLRKIMTRIEEIDDANDCIRVKVMKAYKWAHRNPQVVFNGRPYSSILEWAREHELKRSTQRRRRLQKMAAAKAHRRAVIPWTLRSHLLDILPPINTVEHHKIYERGYLAPGQFGPVTIVGQKAEQHLFAYCHEHDVNKKPQRHFPEVTGLTAFSIGNARDERRQADPDGYTWAESGRNEQPRMMRGSLVKRKWLVAPILKTTAVALTIENNTVPAPLPTPTTLRNKEAALQPVQRRRSPPASLVERLPHEGWYPVKARLGPHTREESLLVKNNGPQSELPSETAIAVLAAKTQWKPKALQARPSRRQTAPDSLSTSSSSSLSRLPPAHRYYQR